MRGSKLGCHRKRWLVDLDSLRSPSRIWETGRTHPSPSQIAQLRQFLPLPGRSTSTSRESDTRAALSEGPAAFGAWLSKTRALRQMTVPELAERSGVSAVAIYNLEGGRTTNPRRQTQASLSKALGQSPPAEVEEQAQQSADISGLGALEDFDPHSDADLPAEAGIYVLYDISERPIYVGESENIRRRIRQHSDSFWFKFPIVSSGSFVRVENKELRRQTEQVLIRFLKSNAVINRQHVDRA